MTRSDVFRCRCCHSRCCWSRLRFQPRFHYPRRRTLLSCVQPCREEPMRIHLRVHYSAAMLPSASSVFIPFTETKLLLALLLVHGAVAVQVVQSPPFFLALAGGGPRRPAVLLALLCLEDGGHVFTSVAGDVGHVLPPSSSCRQKNTPQSNISQNLKEQFHILGNAVKLCCV